MIYRSAVLTALLLCAALAPAAPMADPIIVYSYPSLPHGLDWSILLPPNPEIPQTALPAGELKRILPPVFAMSRAEGLLAFGPLAPSRDPSPAHPFVAMITGTAFLLAAYDLIPRLRSHVLRFRSVNLKQDLLT